MVRRGVGSQAGFTYLGALILIAIMGAVLGSVGTVWHTLSQREKERELLYVGGQFRQAIQQYHDQTPGALKQYPKTLDELLHDSRHSVVRRHIRKIFVDPMTGSNRWGLVMAEQGGIRGVYSLSDAEAIKTGNFLQIDRAFEGKVLVGEWHFTHGAASRAPASDAPGVDAPMPAASSSKAASALPR
jgi:type II secretory pathway pseudopilin PulG